MIQGKIKVGILMDSYQIPAWIYRSIERIVNSDFAEVSLVILLENGAKTSDKSDNLAKRKWIFYKLFNLLDEKIFVKEQSALKWMDAHELLSGTHVITMIPAQNGNEKYFRPDQLETVARYELDVLVEIGFGELGGDILSLPRYGVWGHHFANEPHGFWETVNGQSETHEYLFSLNGSSIGRKAIYHSSSNTYLLSPARNRNRSLWKSSSFLPRQLALLKHLGQTNFFLETEKYRKDEPRDQKKTFETPPSNLLCTWLVGKMAFRIVGDILLRLFYSDAWFLLFNMHSSGKVSYKDFIGIVPPKDRFWADPMVIQSGGHFFVFIEEFIHKEKKGHLSVLEVDQPGCVALPQKIIEEKYHLSYPFVFEWKGQYFMIPESASNKSIDLYQCMEFPHKWEYKMNLMHNILAVDTTLIFHQGKWWLFTGICENKESFPEVELFLYYSDELFTQDWKPHPLNPIVSDVKSARPAGRIFIKNGKLVRPSQDCSRYYGYGFDLNEILLLSEDEYIERIETSVRPTWDKKIKAVHTYGIERDFQIIDAYALRRKILSRNKPILAIPLNR